jgi:hypothetical protein
MTRCIISAAVLAAFLQLPALSQVGEPKDAKALDHFVGNWHAQVIEKSSTSTPDGANHTHIESTSWTLVDRFILGREMRQTDGVKSLWLMTYDSNTKTYPFWFFNSMGVLGGEWRGTWDEPRKTMTLEATDTPPGWTSQSTIHFPDDQSADVGFWMKDESGTLLSVWDATKSRQPDDAGAKTLAAWSMTKKSDAPRSPELTVLERLVGTWDVTAVSQPAEWTPQEVRTTSVVTRSWILDGSFVMDSSMHDDETESLALFTYDPQENTYRSWWFSSEGYTVKSAGQWDDVTETLSFQSERDGITSRSVVRFIDDDHHDWRVVSTDSTGKLYFDTKWILTRSKR